MNIILDKPQHVGHVNIILDKPQHVGHLKIILDQVSACWTYEDYSNKASV